MKKITNYLNKKSFLNASFLGFLLVGLCLIGFNAGAQTTSQFTANGAFVVPAGITTVQVEAWGGGGAGGTAVAQGSQTRVAGGGAGGAYVKNASVTVTPGASISVTVGGGGTGNTGTRGNSGGNTIFSSGTAVTASGGLGGFNSNGSTPGAGAAATSGTLNGGAGAAGTTTVSGAGGGGAGNVTAGGNATSGVATGGAGGTGTIAGGTGGASVTGTGAGNNGAGLSAGGSGGRSTNSGDDIGGAGFKGQLVVTYTCPNYALTSPITTPATLCGSAGAVVTLNSSATDLPVGTYTVSYSLAGASNSTTTASMTVTTAGTGTFTTSALAIGTTTITVTNLASGSPTACSNNITTNNTASVTIVASPTAVAGTNVSTCSNAGAVNITAGASATNNAGVTWTSNGTGTFTNPNSLTLATYTPSAADITAGSRTLTLTATGNSPCGDVISTKTITFTAAPTVDAGSNVITCASTASVNITAGATASNNASVLWTTSGTGSFANATSLTTATYTPSTADKTAGSVTLTLTANGNGTCAAATDTKILTINAVATAVAGTAVTTCSNAGAVNITAGSSATNNSGVLWTSNGTGTFTNANSLTLATYTPSAADITAGSRTLTLTASGNSPCGNAISTKTITITAAPTANAGTNVSTCSSTASVNITAGATSTNNGGILWTSNGSGSFTNATSLTTATYTPSANDKIAGSVILTLTANGNGTCADAIDTKTLTITPAATAVAGTAISTCSNAGAVNITAGSSASNNTGVLWTSNGSGTFSNATSLTDATYTPSAADITAGSRTLTLTATGNSPCGNAISTKTITITAAPTAEAGTDVTMCSAVPSVNITSGASATNHAGVLWTSNGTGSFTNATSLTTATYSPSLDDITAGSVILTLTATGNGTCNNAVDTKTLIINATPTVVAPMDQNFCDGILTSPIILSGTPSGVTYDISGGSSIGLHNATNVTSIAAFTPSTGTATVTITPKSNGCTGTAVTFQITVNPIVTPVFDAVAPICAGGVLEALPTTSNNGVTGSWSPALDNTATTTYTFTPDSGQCTPVILTTITILVNSNTTYYADTDGDTYGDAGNTVSTCLAMPAGYVKNDTDCDDTNSLIYRNGQFYVDADNDGYYNGNPATVTVCYGATLPLGYVTEIIGADCDDDNFNANPNHVEIANNSIDDNCDGITDEAGPTTSLIASQCGITLSNIANALYAGLVPVAEGYRFEIVNGVNVQTYDTTTNSFSLANLLNIAYGTTYTIRVAVKTNGFWRAYNTACAVTTPAAPATTNVVASQCGITLPLMSTTIYANQVTLATQYRFEVSDGVNAARTYDTAFNRFSLTNLSGQNQYATTYSVRVALRIGGVWQDFGPACSVTTPATPGFSAISSPQCGTVITNSWATIYASPVADAQGYRFEVKNGALTRYYDNVVPRMNLHNLNGASPAPNTTYTIRVAILFNNVYQNFGPTCSISTAAAITRQAAEAVSVFDAKAYPNPFASTFRLDMNTSDEANVEIKVYDMLGRQIDAKELNVSDAMSQELGDQYPSGVYNIVVTQGNEVKTLRVIKR